jgi:hypothetical protein
MAESLFGQLFAILIIAIVLASLAGSMPQVIQFFMTIAGFVFGGAVIGITIMFVFKR